MKRKLGIADAGIVPIGTQLETVFKALDLPKIQAAVVAFPHFNAGGQHIVGRSFIEIAAAAGGDALEGKIEMLPLDAQGRAGTGIGILPFQGDPAIPQAVRVLDADGAAKPVDAVGQHRLIAGLHSRYHRVDSGSHVIRRKERMFFNTKPFHSSTPFHCYRLTSAQRAFARMRCPEGYGWEPSCI